MRFTNRFDSSKSVNFRDILKWKLFHRAQKDIKSKAYKLPSKDDKALLDTGEDFICWLSHATFLIQINSKRFLFDPVFKSIPFYKRKSPFPYKTEDLGTIDYLFISHTHYDHFDEPSVKKVLNQNPKVITPLGMQKYIKKIDKNADVFCMDWYDRYELDSDISIYFVPAKHWGRRGLNDTNKALWGGFVIETPNSTIYFSGDTAYDTHFKEIGEKFNIDYALLPIGAYKPEFIMKNNHTNPNEAYKAYKDLKAKKMIPMHYGTFKLSDEPLSEPLEWIKKIQSENENEIVILKSGEVLKI